MEKKRSMAVIVRRAGLFVFLIACHSEKPTVTSDTPTQTSASVSASASSSAVPSLGPATGHVALGASGTGVIDDNKVYSVDGTTLRILLKNSMRATPISGGHVWSGQLTVCDGPSTCTDLNLSGPDQPPGEWHGFVFVLAFVTPTTLTITRK
jgi:hypothetical protein